MNILPLLVCWKDFPNARRRRSTEEEFEGERRSEALEGTQSDNDFRSMTIVLCSKLPAIQLTLHSEGFLIRENRGRQLPRQALTSK